MNILVQLRSKVTVAFCIASLLAVLFMITPAWSSADVAECGKVDDCSSSPYQWTVWGCTMTSGENCNMIEWQWCGIKGKCRWRYGQNYNMPCNNYCARGAGCTPEG